MANTAAQLVDRVLPSVPVRQWVLSLPFELRALAAFDAKVLSAFARFFASAVDAHHRASATRAGVANVDRTRTGAVTFVQRFGSSLNLNVHFHTCFLDGLYTRDDAGRLVFHEATPPRREELEAVVRTIHRRTLRWLARHGHLDRTPLEERSSDRTIPSPIEACAAIATQRGTLGTLAAESSQPGKAHASGDVDLDSAVREGGAFEHEGFNLHAKVRIASDDDLGRERLCRYGARPPFSLDRLRVLPGGRVSYRIKKVGGGRSKHRIMTPLEFIAQLSALVPPPRYPLVRYHGVLAPHSAWRREIVPRPPMASRTGTAGAGGKQEACGPSHRGDTAPTHGGASSRTAGHADRDGRDNQSSRSPVVAKRTDAALGAVAERDRAPSSATAMAATRPWP